MKKTLSIEKLLKQAKKKFKEGLYFDAEELYLSILKINSNQSEALLQLAFIYQYRKDFNKAIDYYTQFLNLNPSNGKIFYLRAENYKLIEKKDFATKDYEQAKKLGYSEKEYMEEAQKMQKDTFNKIVKESNQNLLIGLSWTLGAVLITTFLILISSETLVLKYWHKSISVVAWVVDAIILFIGISHIVKFWVIRKALKPFKISTLN